uniref:4'-phosphopantetheinyl transferase (Putative 4'-phosphopantetheinyl transferase)) n=1 Tax=Ganoderma boninense TaxID=34458 RepID=A0A5K1JZL7_9APHY|nr:4'-phosphopantetheinyl transferase (EC (Colibactin biosynthesis phosphopantetheinyl transferase ClbA) (Putative 4'-phosphopantetheinyl transferase) [Ganoderma boninense]
MAQPPSTVVPYTYSARVLIKPGIVTVLHDGAPSCPDVVNAKLTVTRRFDDDLRSLEEESDTSDEEHLQPSNSLRAPSQSTIRTARSAASSRATTPIASVRVEAIPSSYDVPPSNSATVGSPPIRLTSRISSRQATPQRSSSATPPESATQRPSSTVLGCPSLEELTAQRKHSRVTRSASRSSLNIEHCRPETSANAANKGSGNTYRATPVLDDDDDDFSQYQRVTKKCLQTDEEKIAGAKYVTAWYYSEAGYSLSAPPTGMAKHPDLKAGDIFFHVVTHLEEPQMWVWVELSSGRCLWKVVVKGESRREDNRRLTVGLDSKKGAKKPVWVTDTWYKKMKDTARSKGKGKGNASG